jgi:hypothetical protein
VILIQHGLLAVLLWLQAVEASRPAVVVVLCWWAAWPASGARHSPCSWTPQSNPAPSHTARLSQAVTVILFKPFRPQSRTGPVHPTARARPPGPSTNRPRIPCCRWYYGGVAWCRRRRGVVCRFLPVASVQTLSTAPVKKPCYWQWRSMIVLWWVVLYEGVRHNAPWPAVLGC